MARRNGWTLNKQQWDHLIQIVSGTEWRKSSLDSLYQDDIPTSAGVYAICCGVSYLPSRPFGKLYNVIYIGKAESLRKRFLDHCMRPKIEIRQAKQCFREILDYWFTSVTPDRVDELESCLIDCLGPPGNLIGGRRILARIGSPRPA
jgi:hypothetical protein